MNENEIIDFARDWMGTHLTEAVHFERSEYVGPYRWRITFSDEQKQTRRFDVVVYDSPDRAPSARISEWHTK